MNAAGSATIRGVLQAKALLSRLGPRNSFVGRIPDRVSREHSRPEPLFASTPPGALIYVVGDIHGRADLLKRLVAMLRADSAERSGGHRPMLMFLGDYVDRGPESRAVLDEMVRLKSDPWFKIYCLCGNHDQFLLDFLEQPQVGSMWLEFGGAATLASYGVQPPQSSNASAWIAAGRALGESMPADHLDFIRTTSLYSTFGDYVFVHAGVRPGVALRDQHANDLTAIREAFLETPDPLPGRVVVFGHTPYREPLVQPRKIGLDTGACVTGRLTALALQDGERRFLQTGNPDRVWALPDVGNEPDEPSPRL